MSKSVILVIFSVLAIACAGPNPNPGERTTDMGWSSGNYQLAFDTAKPHAELGEPWAQLRLGIFYSNGWGVEKNNSEALAWFTKAASQKSSGKWAEGQVVGAAGKSGYFNQNSDAIIAQYQLAQLYFAGDGNEKSLSKALEFINVVIAQTNGSPVFFCCEFSQSRYFNPQDFQELKSKIEAELSK